MTKTTTKLVCAICDESGVHKVDCKAHWYNFPRRSQETLSAYWHNRLAVEARRNAKLLEGIAYFMHHGYKGVDKHNSSACCFCGQGSENHAS